MLASIGIALLVERIKHTEESEPSKIFTSQQIEQHLKQELTRLEQEQKQKLALLEQEQKLVRRGLAQAQALVRLARLEQELARLAQARLELKQARPEQEQARLEQERARLEQERARLEQERARLMPAQRRSQVQRRIDKQEQEQEQMIRAYSVRMEKELAQVIDKAAQLNENLLVRPLIDRLKKATISYNRISEMMFEKPETVVFRLGLGEVEPVLSLALPGLRTTVETVATPEMSLELSGSYGLEISPVGRTKKRISDIEPTTWQWKVTPNVATTQYLTLTVYVHLSVDSALEPYTLKSFTDTIRVNVSTPQLLLKIASDIQPAWVFIVATVPTVWGSYAWFRRKEWRVDKEKPKIKVLYRRGRKR